MVFDSINILGIMSGTSLDGLDLALCNFQIIEGNCQFKLLFGKTFPYNSEWKNRLKEAYTADATTYFELHSAYGKFIGTSILNFLKEQNESVDFIASHGHTIFHKPINGFSTQIGCGATIAAITNIPTICDFRNLDVALKGQGAPLVPIGDRDLFPEAESCLNIGGIANITFTKNNKTKAFDICIANMALNFLTEKIGKSFDDKGLYASKGIINNELLSNLLNLKTSYKSLGREWFEADFLPFLRHSTISVNDLLATCTEYTAIKIAQTLRDNDLKSVLITGGGAYNIFLLERIKHVYKGIITIPSKEIIEFKEAIIFAYLGYLRIKNKINTLSSVTGALKDSCGGAIYHI